ncbi:hypothetical protein SNEBB_011199 [Seison nebaliae]|nr:hypothetical protein SNEBB_011199 [Seison nebaliae]
MAATDDIFRRSKYFDLEEENRSRTIDFILVYRLDKYLAQIDLRERIDYYLNCMKWVGLDIETHRGEGNDNLIFVKIHAPFDLLLNVADKIKLRLPIQRVDIETKQQQLEGKATGFLQRFLYCASCRNLEIFDLKTNKLGNGAAGDGIVESDEDLNFDEFYHFEKKDYFRYNYSNDLRHRFQSLFDTYRPGGRANYFTTGEKAQLIYELLLRLPYETIDDDEDYMETMKNSIDDFTIIFSDKSSEMKEMKKMSERTKSKKDEKEFFNQKISNMSQENFLRAIFTKAWHKAGIDRLIDNKTFLAAYAPHETIIPIHRKKSSRKTYHYLKPKENFELNDRTVLEKEWAPFKRFMQFQPYTSIRRYFGVKIAFYFAWFGFYTQFLILAAICGLVVFIYGMMTLSSSEQVKDICDVNRLGGTLMCPLCDSLCKFWYLNESCIYSKLTYIFDNEGTLFFSMFMAIWSILFLELWKRRQSTLRYDWDLGTNNERELLEPIRPNYERRSTRMKRNPITGHFEPYFSFYKRLYRMFISFSACFTMIAVVIIAMVGVIIYRVAVSIAVASTSYVILRKYSKIFTACTASTINLIAIMFLGYMYKLIAKKMTDFELHKFQSSYEASFTLKHYLFEFANNYSALFYIAFFKGTMTNAPGEKRFFIFGKFKTEACDPAGCLSELCIQLIIIMSGQQIMGLIMEVVFPSLKLWISPGGWIHRCRGMNGNHIARNDLPTFEKDFHLNPVTHDALFTEYLKLALQFGFVTLFAVAFPLAPLLALMNNIIEIRIDAQKFLRKFRRIKPAMVTDIGIWQSIIEVISRLAVITNATIIAWTSDFIPKSVYKYHTNKSNNDLVHYVNHSLSVFNIQSNFGNETECRYRGYRNPPGHEDEYKFSSEYWYILVARLAFVLVFEHLVFLLMQTLGYLIPDVPYSTRMMIRRQHYVQQQMLWGEWGQKPVTDEDQKKMRNELDKLIDEQSNERGKSRSDDILNYQTHHPSFEGQPYNIHQKSASIPSKFS